MKQSLILLFILALCILLVACTPTTLYADESHTVYGGSKTSTSTVKNDYVIGFSNYSLSNSWRIQMVSEFIFTANQMVANGLIKDFIVCNSENDESRQVNDIEGFIEKKVDAILVTAFDSPQMTAVLEKAEDSGIVVVNFDQLVSTNHISAQVVYDEYTYGLICGKFMTEALGGEGKIVSLRFTQGTSTDTNRQRGFEDGIFGSNIEIIDEIYTDCEYEKSKSAIRYLIQKHSQIDGVWAMGGACAQASVEVFIEEDRPMIPVTGEGINGFLKIWSEHKEQLPSVAPCAPTSIGIEALNISLNILNGQQVEKVTSIPLPVITANSLNQYVRNDLPDDFWCYTQVPYNSVMEYYNN